MRKVVSYFVYSLDGVVHNPQDWVFDRFDEEMYGRLKKVIETQDAVLLGRRTYEGWVDFWPNSTHEPFASFINNTQKHVVSTTLEKLEWRNSSLIDSDFAGNVERMKREPGGDIGVHGSVSLVRALMKANLLDELRLAMFPVVAGSAAGIRLFDDFEKVHRLELVSAEPTGKGVLFLTYKA